MLHRIPGLHFHDARTVPEALLQRALDLRARFMAIKPDVGVEVDRAKMLAQFRTADVLWIATDPSGAATSLFCHWIYPQKTAGIPWTLVYSDYGFVAAGARKSLRMGLGYVLGLWYVRLRHPLRPMWLCDGAYPYGACAVGQIGEVKLLDDPKSPWEQQAFLET